MPKILKPDGTWHEGKAAPKLLEPELRDLPSEHVAEDPSEADKIHRVDPPHIRESLLAEIQQKEAEEAAGQKKDFDFETFMTVLHCLPTMVKPKRVTRFRQVSNPQWEVDRIRTRVCTVLTMQAAAMGDIESFHTKRHVWFPEDNLNHYHLRTGNPPSSKSRPHFLKKLELHIDLLHWPKPILDYLKRMGLDVDLTTDLLGGILHVQ